MPIWLIPKLLGVFGWLKKAADAAWGFAKRYPLQCALALAIVVCGWLWHINGVQKDAIKILGGKVSAERKAHQETIFNFKKAQTDAEAIQTQNLLRVAQAYTDINERKENALKADRDSAVAGYKRLLANAESYRSAPGNAEMSADADAACIAYSATRCAELPAKLKAAQDNTDQLVALIDYVKSIAAVPTSPDTGGH